MEETHPLLQILAMDAVVWGSFTIVIFLAVTSAFRPAFQWPINTTKFMDIAEKLVREDNEDRLRKLTDAAPSAHMIQLVRAWLDGDDFEAKHQELASTRRIHFIKLAFVDLLVTAFVGVTVLAWSLGHFDFRLVVGSAISFPVVAFGLYSNFKIGSDARDFLANGVERLRDARQERDSSW